MLFDIDNPPSDYSKPFDIWAFGGNGSWSILIKILTCSLRQWIRGETPSHIAISTPYYGPVKQYNGCNLLWESTELVDLPCCLTGLNTTGVQAHPILDRIRVYNGKVWRYRLDEDISCLVTQDDLNAASSFLVRKLGSPYDMQGALLSGTEYLRSVRWLSRNNNMEFCSDVVMDLLKTIRITDRNCNSKEYNPARAIRDLAYMQIYQPIYPGSESGRVK